MCFIPDSSDQITLLISGGSVQGRSHSCEGQLEAEFISIRIGSRAGSPQEPENHAKTKLRLHFLPAAEFPAAYLVLLQKLVDHFVTNKETKTVNMSERCG
jgi:hypothetical protein